jgi:myosin heavy subunit
MDELPGQPPTPPTPVDVNRKMKARLVELQQLGDGIENEIVPAVTEITGQVGDIRDNVRETYNNILEIFGKESVARRKIVAGMAEMARLLEQCRKMPIPRKPRGDEAVPQEDEDPEEALRRCRTELEANQRELTQCQQQLNEQVPQLQEQLREKTQQFDELKEEHEQLKKRCRELRTEETDLTRINEELVVLNTQYSDEIQKQKTLYQRITEALQALKQSLTNLVYRTDPEEVKQKVLLAYVPDTMLAEIREAVLKDPQFNFIDAGGNLDTIVDRVLGIINTTWLVNVNQTKEELTQMVGTLTADNSPARENAAIQESVSLWRQYLAKLVGFLSTWAQKARDFVRQWVQKRNPNLR